MQYSQTPQSGQNMILTRKLEKNQRKTMEAVIEEHTRAATQMREMTTVDTGRITGRLTVITVRDGRKNMLCLRIKSKLNFPDQGQVSY